MKIAIHYNDGVSFFSKRWIKYCIDNNIDYKIVNAYDTNIINDVSDCDLFMWHHSNYIYKDALFSKQLLYSLQIKGIKVFPDFNTTWHFDDKLGQKYLLESIKAPMVNTYSFFSKEDALLWVDKTTFPKVFKLRGGSGSSNVRLVTSKRKAIKLIRKAFSCGFSQYNRISNFKERLNQYRAGKDSFLGVLKGFARIFISTKYSKMYIKEKGYVYFQDFIPNNSFDIRVILINDKAFALKRIVRKNDFRASGGGNIVYSKNEIDLRCIEIAFSVNEVLKTQSIAFDFVFNEQNTPLIVEISYGFAADAYDNCEGYWDKDLNWYAGRGFNFCGWMIQDLINK